MWVTQDQAHVCTDMHDILLLFVLQNQGLDSYNYFHPIHVSSESRSEKWEVKQLSPLTILPKICGWLGVVPIFREERVVCESEKPERVVQQCGVSHSTLSFNNSSLWEQISDSAECRSSKKHIAFILLTRTSWRSVLFFQPGCLISEGCFERQRWFGCGQGIKPVIQWQVNLLPELTEIQLANIFTVSWLKSVARRYNRLKQCKHTQTQTQGSDSQRITFRSWQWEEKWQQ